MSPTLTTSLMQPLTKLRSVNLPILEKLTRNIYPGLFCGIVILILTGLPGSCFPHVKPTLGLDKVAHVVMFAGFGFLSIWGYREPFEQKDKNEKRKSLIFTLLVSIVFGALTEVMQETICINRTGSVYDFIADVIGSVFGISFFTFLQKKKNKIAV